MYLRVRDWSYFQTLAQVNIRWAAVFTGPGLGFATLPVLRQ